MKIIPRALALLTTFAACHLGQADTNQPSEVEMLRSEIARQELVLSALKDKLAKLERLSGKVDIQIPVSGGIYYRGNKVTSKELTEQLSDLPMETKVMVDADHDTPLKTIQEVLRACAGAGLTDLVFATSERPEQAD